MKIIKTLSIIWLLSYLVTWLVGGKAVMAVKCSDTKPDGTPDLFQIDATRTSAKLYFTPVNNAISGYTIIYGTERGRDDFGVSFPYGRYDGVIDFTINALNPNTKYYFRVKAYNGCRHGLTSDTMSATTDLDFKAYTKFKGDSEEQSKKLLEIPEKTEDPLMIMQVTEEIKEELIDYTVDSPDIEKSNQKKESKNIVMEFFSLIISKIKSFFN